MRLIMVITIITVSIFLIQCSSTKILIGEEKLVGQSAEKPDWVVSDETYFVDEGRMNFRVFSTEEADLSFGLSQGLQGKMIEFLIPAIQMRINLEFDESVKGSKYSKETIGQVRQMVTNAAGEVTIRDVLRSAEYWEKWSRTETGNRISYFYNVYALNSIAEDEYYNAKNQVYTNAKQDANNQEAQELLDEVKSRFQSRQD